MTRKQSWAAAYYVLFAAFLATAALNMLRVRGGFLTNHAADLVVPAWLYIVSRGLHQPRARRTLLQRTVGRSPESTAATLFIASTLTEISQSIWPTGVFAGRFDSLDILAYACGVGACYAADKTWPHKWADGA